MGSKLGLILSLSFIFFAILFGTDLVMIQLQYTDLDSFSSVVSYRISKAGRIDDSLIKMCEEKSIKIKGSSENQSGNLEYSDFTYSLTKEYTPFVLGKEPMDITITRHTVISIFN